MAAQAHREGRLPAHHTPAVLSSRLRAEAGPAAPVGLCEAPGDPSGGQALRPRHWCRRSSPGSGLACGEAGAEGSPQPSCPLAYGSWHPGPRLGRAAAVLAEAHGRPSLQTPTPSCSQCTGAWPRGCCSSLTSTRSRPCSIPGPRASTRPASQPLSRTAAACPASALRGPRGSWQPPRPRVRRFWTLASLESPDLG